MSDLDELKRANAQRQMAHPDYHPTVRDDHPLPMVRCPRTGVAERGTVWMSMTEQGRPMCDQCSTDDEAAAIVAARVSRS
jgi:hypothetical protein